MAPQLKISVCDGGKRSAVGRKENGALCSILTMEMV